MVSQTRLRKMREIPQNVDEKNLDGSHHYPENQEGGAGRAFTFDEKKGSYLPPDTDALPADSDPNVTRERPDGGLDPAMLALAGAAALEAGRQQKAAQEHRAEAARNPNTPEARYHLSEEQRHLSAQVAYEGQDRAIHAGAAPGNVAPAPQIMAPNVGGPETPAPSPSYSSAQSAPSAAGPIASAGDGAEQAAAQARLEALKRDKPELVASMGESAIYLAPAYEDFTERPFFYSAEAAGDPAETPFNFPAMASGPLAYGTQEGDHTSGANEAEATNAHFEHLRSMGDAQIARQRFVKLQGQIAQLRAKGLPTQMAEQQAGWMLQLEMRAEGLASQAERVEDAQRWIGREDAGYEARQRAENAIAAEKAEAEKADAAKMRGPMAPWTQDNDVAEDNFNEAAAVTAVAVTAAAHHQMQQQPQMRAQKQQQQQAQAQPQPQTQPEQDQRQSHVPLVAGAAATAATAYALHRDAAPQVRRAQGEPEADQIAEARRASYDERVPLTQAANELHATEALNENAAPPPPAPQANAPRRAPDDAHAREARMDARQPQRVEARQEVPAEEQPLSPQAVAAMDLAGESTQKQYEPGTSPIDLAERGVVQPAALPSYVSAVGGDHGHTSYVFHTPPAAVELGYDAVIPLGSDEGGGVGERAWALAAEVEAAIARADNTNAPEPHQNRSMIDDMPLLVPDMDAKVLSKPLAGEAQFTEFQNRELEEIQERRDAVIQREVRPQDPTPQFEELAAIAFDAPGGKAPRNPAPKPEEPKPPEPE